MTPEQEVKLDEYYVRYLQLGLESRPTDRPRAEAAIKKMYAAAELREPEIMWFQSWLAMAQYAKSKRLDVGTGWDGQFDAGYFAWINFYREVLGLVAETEEVMPAWEVFLSAGPMIEYDGLCLVSERASKIQTDEEGNLHCADGPAVLYSDGDAQYYWHGFDVDAWVILEPNKITPAIIKAEANAELRRILMERYGLWRYLADSGAEVVEEDYDGGTRAVPGPNGHRVLLRDGNTTALLCGDPSTGRVYALDVPPAMTTCAEADAFLSHKLKRERQWGRS